MLIEQIFYYTLSKFLFLVLEKVKIKRKSASSFGEKETKSVNGKSSVCDAYCQEQGRNCNWNIVLRGVSVIS